MDRSSIINDMRKLSLEYANLIIDCGDQIDAISEASKGDDFRKTATGSLFLTMYPYLDDKNG